MAVRGTVDSGAGGTLVTSVTGTASQVTASPTTGSVVVGLPAAVVSTSFNGSTLAISTQQVFLTGTSATYNRPANVRQIVVTIKGGGASGNPSGTAAVGTGNVGGDTSFNSIVAKGGTAAIFGQGGGGGTGGTGSAVRRSGEPGQCASALFNGAASAYVIGGSGGGSGAGLGGGSGAAGGDGAAGVANMGGGGGAGGAAAAIYSTIGTYTHAGGGGEGETASFIINSPASTYTYTVGAGGAAVTAGTNGGAGGPGGSGIIVVYEYY